MNSRAHRDAGRSTLVGLGDRRPATRGGGGVPACSGPAFTSGCVAYVMRTHRSMHFGARRSHQSTHSLERRSRGDRQFVAHSPPRSPPPPAAPPPPPLSARTRRETVGAAGGGRGRAAETLQHLRAQVAEDVEAGGDDGHHASHHAGHAAGHSTKALHASERRPRADCRLGSRARRRATRPDGAEVGVSTGSHIASTSSSWRRPTANHLPWATAAVWRSTSSIDDLPSPLGDGTRRSTSNSSRSR